MCYDERKRSETEIVILNEPESEYDPFEHHIENDVEFEQNGMIIDEDDIL